ncbi:phosphoribosyl-ATP pyrophosphohydrolase [Oceanobacillus sp. FSL H7-0719]|uniref:phosphoribosyl-ATP pyrophosphohydrolase n=1 Tax=Oceanobacillus sp. FSL H7-0719 TaxID=2954507 RepID=UPI0032558BC5
MTTYHKLIRDRIPEVLEQSDRTFSVETLNHDRYILELKKKLDEELAEYQAAATNEEALEELADILEVIHCLSGVHQASFEELEQIRAKKEAERGSFKEKLFLVEVDDK